MHLTNDYMTLDANGQAAVINQPQGVFRMAVSNASETLSMIVPDSDQAGVYDVYHGTGSASNVVYGVSTAYYSDGWTPTLESNSVSISITPDGTAEEEYAEVDPATTVDDFYQGTIPGETDKTGREYSYEYDTDGFLTKKTFDADSTYEEYAYNSFKQTTRIRDRQGNVVQYEYDANGNLTKQKTGLKEVGGQDVAQSEYAERQWDYYPVGHANAGLLKTAYDAEWDGSSTDLHRTDYEYNAHGLMTKKLESASVTGGDRPETLWTYDTEDRVATTTDPGGHQSDDTYNDRGQLIEKEYDDPSTEQTLYGALGTPEEGLVVKTKDRRNVVTSYTYDSAGRTTQVTVGTAWDSDILDGNADDTPITDRNEQSITTYVYLDGTELPIEVVRDGSKTEFVYDYRQRVIETKVYPYANKIMSSKVVYVDNKKFSDEDYYGRKKYYGYRASDGQLIRYVTGAYPSFSLTDQTAVFNLVRDTNLNPAYTIKDAITDENGRPETVIDERGTQFLTEYNAAGQVIRETKAVGTPVEAITEMDYDDDGNVIEIRSPRYFDSTDTNGYQKCKTVMTYDGQGRVLTRTEAPGTPEAATESYAYDSEGRQVTRTDARGKIWTTTYASCCGHSVSSKNPLGHGSISNKDNGGLVTHKAGIGDVDTHTTLIDPIDAKTLRETTTRHDALGRSKAACTWLAPQGIIDPENPPMAGFDGISGQDGLTSQQLYDSDLTDGIGLDSTAGVTVTNPLGGTFTVSLSAALSKMAEPIAQGGAETSFNAEATGSASVSLNAENEVSFSISDALGRKIIGGILHPHDPLPGNTHGDLLTWSCQVHDTTEQLGNGETVLTSVNVDALGHTTKARSNALGHTIETVDQLGFANESKFDAAGNMLKTRDPNNTGYDMVCDAVGRITSRTDMVGSQTQFSFNKSGHKLQAIDAKGHTTNNVFDALGRRISQTDRLGLVTIWEFDSTGNMTALITPTGESTLFHYNDLGDLATVQYPDHILNSNPPSDNFGRVLLDYDATRRRVSRTEQSGDQVTHTFDLAGRLESRTYTVFGGSGVQDIDQFTHDRAGRVIVASKGRYSNTVVRQHDDAGYLINEQLQTHGNSYLVGYGRDALGKATVLTAPNSIEVSRTYTPTGSLHTTSYSSPSGVSNLIASLSYDPGGREVSRSLGSVVESFAYQNDNYCVGIDTPGIESFTYSYDENKNITSETRSGVMSSHSITNSFDDESRLVGQADAAGTTHSIELSGSGDYEKVISDGEVELRQHNTVHELESIQAGSAAGISVEYTPNGSPLNDLVGGVLTWNLDNQLESYVRESTDVILSFEYDAFSRRVVTTSTADSETAVLVMSYAGNQEFQASTQTAGGEESSVFIHGGFVDDVLSELRVDGPTITERYFLRNRQYSLTASISATGQVERFASYSVSGDAFQYDSAGVQTNWEFPFGLAGRPFDPRTGLYHMRERTFSPRVGRFLERDANTYADGPNLYASYFMPNYVDPSGGSILSVVKPSLRRKIGDGIIGWYELVKLRNLWRGGGVVVQYVKEKRATLTTSCNLSALENCHYEGWTKAPYNDHNGVELADPPPADDPYGGEAGCGLFWVGLYAASSPVSEGSNPDPIDRFNRGKTTFKESIPCGQFDRRMKGFFNYPLVNRKQGYMYLNTCCKCMSCFSKGGHAALMYAAASHKGGPLFNISPNAYEIVEALEMTGNIVTGGPNGPRTTELPKVSYGSRMSCFSIGDELPYGR
ncbi:MAG: RHS repeat-associated core domain-containing protein [Fuerstiella sp.]